MENLDTLNKYYYTDEELYSYYDIILDINSLENLQINGWKLEATEKGIEKYMKNKNKNCTLVSILGNKNKGKTFILSKLSNYQIPDGINITTKGLSIIYPKYEDKNIIFLDTPGFENPLCEDDEFVKFKTNNKFYLKLDEKEKKNVSIKDYLTEDEYIEQIIKFNRDKINTNEFIKKFVLYNSNINIYVVNSDIDLDQQNFYHNFIEGKINIIIHNLKTFRRIEEVKNYIEEYLLKSVSFTLVKKIFTIVENEKDNYKNKNINLNYYQQSFENDKNMNIIHLIMANDRSEAGDFYNYSTINYIRKLIETNLNSEKFSILEKVKKFLFEHSNEFFNEPLENIDDIIIDENENILLKYKGKPFELKECYYDELGNTKLINSNYQPNYRVYIAKYKDEKGISDKLIIDIEISGKVKDIKDPVIINKNQQNIITISGKRILAANEKKIGEKKAIKKIAENKSNYFNDTSLFNLKFHVPNETCIIGSLYGKKFDEFEGSYRFIYNILEKIKNVGIEIDSDDDDDYDDDI